MISKGFFSSSAGLVVGAVLLAIVIWMIYTVGPTALDRWFR